MNKKSKGFGTAPVFLTAISTILGAILFLRFGYATGVLGFGGVLLIILLGHLITIPTAFAISEIATNQRVRGGGEYFIISRSFGLNIGATIGISLYLSQAISIAFYVIAFTEAFEPLFNFISGRYGLVLPRQVISMPAMAFLSLLILKKGANMGVKALYVVVAILIISLLLFFWGTTDYALSGQSPRFSLDLRNMNQYFIVFAICFPAFTGMTAGVGLSGELRNPGKSIPLGTTAATFLGMIIYVFIAWKLNISASQEDLTNNQLIMAKIAVMGPLVIPLGLAASTISSALGSVMVAPRTLQALASDKSFPIPAVNRFLAKTNKESKEPFNASLVSCIIAFIFVILGDVNAVAGIISMFFMVTYGALCLISFLNHFGADPSYRPSFKSRWGLSLLGFLMCVWLMFKINTFYAAASIAIMVILYLLISYYHKDRKGLEHIFRSAIFQMNRNLQIYLQKSSTIRKRLPWRPSAVCVSQNSFDRDNILLLLSWIAHKQGFGTFIHLIKGYFSNSNALKAKEMQEILINKAERIKSNVYIDTIVSPSYTSAIAQIIQLPGISGLENNMVIFEFDKEKPDNLHQIVDNFALVSSGENDVLVLGSSKKPINYKKGIHIWIKSSDAFNANLMILMSYIITGHPSWKNSKISIFNVCKKENMGETKERLLKLINTGRLPISEKNIQMIEANESVSIQNQILKYSEEAGLVMTGFRSERIKHDGIEVFKGFESIGDILFVNSRRQKKIS